VWSVKELSRFFLSVIKLCIGGLQQGAVSSALDDSHTKKAVISLNSIKLAGLYSRDALCFSVGRELHY